MKLKNIFRVSSLFARLIKANWETFIISKGKIPLRCKQENVYLLIMIFSFLRRLFLREQTFNAIQLQHDGFGEEPRFQEPTKLAVYAFKKCAESNWLPTPVQVRRSGSESFRPCFGQTLLLLLMRVCFYVNIGIMLSITFVLSSLLRVIGSLEKLSMLWKVCSAFIRINMCLKITTFLYKSLFYLFWLI